MTTLAIDPSLAGTGNVCNYILWDDTSLGANFPTFAEDYNIADASTVTTASGGDWGGSGNKSAKTSAIFIPLVTGSWGLRLNLSVIDRAGLRIRQDDQFGKILGTTTRTTNGTSQLNVYMVTGRLYYIECRGFTTKPDHGYYLIRTREPGSASSRALVGVVGLQRVYQYVGCIDNTPWLSSNF